MLWTASAWDGSAAANGIAFITEKHSFVVAAEYYIPEIPFTWGVSGKPSSLSVYSTEASAITDLDGIGNTAAWLSYVPEAEGDDGVALGYCTSYVFPNGQRGYLGSAGELEILRQNIYSYWGCRLLLDDYGNYSVLDISSWSSTLSSIEGSTGLWALFSNLYSDSSKNSTYYQDGNDDYSYIEALPFTTLGEVNGVVGEFEAVVENKITFATQGSQQLTVTATSLYPVARDVKVGFSYTTSGLSLTSSLTIPKGSSVSSSSFTALKNSSISITSIDRPWIDSKYYYCF